MIIQAVCLPRVVQLRRVLLLSFTKKDYNLAGRSRSTFGKRQKEQKRQEKRLEKLARKDQRKLDKQNGVVTEDDQQPHMPDEILDDDPVHDEAP